MRILVSEVPLYGLCEDLVQDEPTSHRVRRVRPAPLSSGAHIRQSRPDSGLGFQVKVLKLVEAVPCSLGSGVMGQRAACYKILRKAEIEGVCSSIFSA